MCARSHRAVDARGMRRPTVNALYPVNVRGVNDLRTVPELRAHVQGATASARCIAVAVRMQNVQHPAACQYPCRVGTCPLLGLPRVGVVLRVNTE